MSQQDVYTVSEVVKECLGWPYLTRGRDRKGIDCFGLFLHAAARLGFAVSDYHYENVSEGEYLWFKNFHTYGDAINLKQARPVDVLMFRGGRNIVNHIGVITERGKFLHASKAGVVITSYSSGAWSERIHSCYRFHQK